MKKNFTFKAFLVTVTLNIACSTAYAKLTADKTDIDSSTGKASVSVNFTEASSGDLYIAALVGKDYIFVDSKGTFTNVATPFMSNSQYSNSIHVLDVASDGIPAGTYSLYQVVIKAGSDVFDVNNWIGGFSGLSELKFNINLTNTSASNITKGKALYKSFTCADGGCHGSNPAQNKNNILRGSKLSEIKASIRNNPNEMGFLSSKSDADLQAIADYLKSL